MNVLTSESDVKVEIAAIKYAIDAVFRYVKNKEYYNEQWWLDFEDYLNERSNYDFNKGSLE